MAAEIEFYFDFSSPYGYFAASRIDELAARYGRSVRWISILMPAIFKITGSGPLSPVPLKAPYILRDLERTARFHGIAYAYHQPKNFSMISLAPARAMLWICETYGEAAAVIFAKKCYRAYFNDDIDICDIGALIQIATSQGIDCIEFAAGSQSDAIKLRFKHVNEVAMARVQSDCPSSLLTANRSGASIISIKSKPVCVKRLLSLHH